MTTFAPKARDRNSTVARVLLASLLAASLLAVVVQPVAAVPYLDSEYGSQAVFLLPEINAMGGTGVALYRGGITSIFNPAFLIVEERQRFDISFSAEVETENRYVPLFDSFSSLVADTDIASNRHNYFYGALGYARRLISGRTPVSLGLSLTERYPFNYTFQEEIRDPDSFSDPRDRILEDRAYEVDGGLRFLSVGLAVGLDKVFALGGTVNYAFGRHEVVRKSRNFMTPAESYFESTNFSQDGVNFALGTRIKASERWEFSLNWESRLKVSGNQTREITYGVNPDSVQITNTGESVKYPYILSGGLAYRPRNVPRTVFTLDLVFTNWSDLEDTRSVPSEFVNLRDTVDYRFAIQHTFYNGVPVWFGFRHLNSYANREANANYFSAGLGMNFVKGLLQFSAEIGKVVSEQEHLFEYPSDFQADESARVEDNTFRFGCGYRISW
jgi:hypothetical protein